MTKGTPVIVPQNAPKIGEVYKHYKGELYEVILISEHNDPDELCIVYKPKYENPDFPFFSRLLKSWNEDVEWEGKLLKRFTIVE